MGIDIKTVVVSAVCSAAVVVGTADYLTGERLSIFNSEDESVFEIYADAAGGARLTVRDGGGKDLMTIRNGAVRIKGLEEYKSEVMGRVDSLNKKLDALGAEVDRLRSQPARRGPSKGPSSSAPPTQPPQGNGNNTPPHTPLVDQSVMMRDFKIELVEVRLEEVVLERSDGRGLSASDGKLLVASVRITNTSTRRKQTYESWRPGCGPGSSGASLTDEFDNVLRGTTIGIGSQYKPIGACGCDESLYPGDVVLDRIMFEPPVDGTSEFILKLSANNLGLGSHFDAQFRFSKENLIVN